MLHEQSIVNPDFPLRLYVIEPTEWPIHWHKEIEILFVLEGTLTVELNNRLYQLQKEDILLIGSSDVHWIVPQPFKSRIVGIQFGLSIFDSLSFDPSSKRFISPMLCNSKTLDAHENRQAHQYLKRIIRKMVEENRFKKTGFQMALKARLYDLIVVLLRYVPMDDYTDQGKQRRLEKLERLERVFRYVEKNYGQEVTLEDAAREANISLFYFTRFFKEATGTTFGRYLMDLRVKKARWYLANTEEKITNIAFDTGFSNTTTFNRVFKEVAGVTPSEYRRSKNNRE